MMLIEPLGSNFSEIFIEIHTFSFKKIHLQISSPKRRLFRLCLNVLMLQYNIVSGHLWKKQGMLSASNYEMYFAF